jgi:hypothetical protein
MIRCWLYDVIWASERYWDRAGGLLQDPDDITVRSEHKMIIY